MKITLISTDMKKIITGLIFFTTFSAYAISAKDKEVCQNYQALVKVIVQKADAGIERKQLKQAMSSSPEIFPIIDSVYDQRPRMINQEILSWHFRDCLEDAARNSRRK
jgi:hypothetical protein